VTESDEPTTKLETRETEDKAEEEGVAVTVGQISGDKPLLADNVCVPNYIAQSYQLSASLNNIPTDLTEEAT